MGVLEGFILGPRAISIAEFNAAAERRVAGEPYVVEGAGIRDGEVLLLESDEGFSGSFVVLGDFEAKDIGLVFVVAGDGIGEGS